MSCAKEEHYVSRTVVPGDLAHHQPDAHFEMVGNGEVQARCSVWWTRMPTLQQHRVGMIGHYSVRDVNGVGSLFGGDDIDRKSPSVSSPPKRLPTPLLLNHACRELAAHGCTLAVGPIDGSTWRSYRLITRSSDAPPFFLEPTHPAEWVEHFMDCGFKPLARYFSAVNDDLTRIDPRMDRRSTSLSQMGIALRPVRRETFEADLHHIYSLSQTVFRGNLLYTDLDEAEFTANYRPLLGRAPLELILLAEHAGRAIGFVFAVPDFNEPIREKVSDRACRRYQTLIIKTLATLPDRQYAGLGQWMLAAVQRRAYELGFVRAIHALVRDTPHLRRISGRYARPIREYTLFAKELA